MSANFTLPENNPLFEGIPSQNMNAVFACLKAKRKTFEKNSYIMTAGNPVKDIALILVGAANVIKEDYWGNRTIIDNLVPGEVVGETFAYAQIKLLPLSVVATQPSEVLLLNFEKLLSNCKENCTFHNQLVMNCLRVLANKNNVLMTKVSCMIRRTTRDKLLSYLSSRAQKAGSNSFDIPYNRQELADYLAVDRSAMSNELCKLRDSGVLTFNKNHFVLYDCHDQS